MHRRKGDGALTAKPCRSRCTLVLAVALVAGLAAGCGDSSDDVSAEANEVIRNLKSLKPGEFFIQGQRRERFSGPYTFKAGGYVFSFRRLGDSGRLTVSLESHRGSMQEPYTPVVNTDRAAGTRSLTVEGKRYVHVSSSADGYVLRFTPKRPAR